MLTTDDLQLFRIDNSYDEGSLLQEALKAMEGEWELKFNTKKCNVIRFTKKVNLVPFTLKSYRFSGTPPELVDVESFRKT